MVLGALFGKKPSADAHVIIPEHVKLREEQERLADLKSQRKPGFKLGLAKNPLPSGIPTTFSGSHPRFLVEGLFHVGDFTMIKGRVLAGEVFPGYFFEREGKSFAIKEVQRDGRKDKVIIKGDAGALFLKAGDKPVVFNHEVLELLPPRPKPASPAKKKSKPRAKPVTPATAPTALPTEAPRSTPSTASSGNDLIKLNTPLSDAP